MATAEQRARVNIDQLLEAAGWRVQNLKQAECGDEDLSDTLYELQQFGFLPKDLTL